ncbi:FtsK/SpoIIIE family DNA translocase [Alitiscatomonas aceti]|uniref:DNA translocase FtsK 4TM domain-containing protein n=1 Tax=Alitiscatomonas aceti TaxID=2981724 RepID=A0ABT2UV92_9FIRM|nr:DNA translocase FtsK 4TM domain-containing protein [Alitiscatomonas aceti]MCU6798575.1 DNA translocase FtsK 4TM domain-containing protein [Alitiscatomonas aceti]
MAGSNTKKKTTASGKTAGKKTAGTKTTAAKRTGTKKQEADSSFLQSEAVILGTFAVCVFLFLSNFHICGMLGDMFSSMLLGVFGSIGYVAPVLLFLGTIFYASNKGNIRAVYKMLAVEVLLIVLCGLAQLIFGGGYQEGQTFKEIYETAGESGMGGGVIGGALVLALHKTVGATGSYILLLVFMILCLVCITERSFVMAVKKGSGKAYQYAREDHERRKEIRQEKKEEERLLREEQRVQGVNLHSTDLSAGRPERFTPDMAMPVTEEDLARFSADRKPEEKMETAVEREEKARAAARRDREERRAALGISPQPEPSPVHEEKEEPRPDPADVFRGNITMAGKEPEKETVPFDEDLSLSRPHRDEDVFLSRSSRDFEDMDVFPEGGRPSMEQTAAQAASEAIPEAETFTEPWEEPGETMAKPGKTKNAPAEPEDDGYWLDEDYDGNGNLQNAEKDQTGELESLAELDTEPYAVTEDYWEPVSVQPPYDAKEEPEPAPVFPEAEEIQAGRVLSGAETENTGEIPVLQKAEEKKQIVTAAGKVIETDAEEIIRQKAEKRRREAEAAKAAEERQAADAAVRQEIQKKEEKPRKPYVAPPLELLKKGPGAASGQSEKEFKETAIKLQQTLRNFGVGVTVTNISCGPTVTRYELHPEQGVKVSKIQSLADDIKLNLAATDIRIEAPIPGKAAVGIEVPNKVNSIVYLRELLESPEIRQHPSSLAFAVGKDIGGQPVVADLAKMPHLLIAGQTGSGKSVGINTMIMSLIYRSSPEDVKLIMIDPKVVELSVYNGIPHLLIPVVTDPKKAAGALNWAVAEMMDRYQKFAQSNVRDLKGYNARVKSLMEAGDVPADQIPAKLPQLVIIIDELADLMMVASSEVEDSICRLAQLARAAGIHLVIATQRPSVNVITGVIKANVPSRIAFSVASGVDSRTILDMNGAEKLLGNGDMLFYPSGYPKPLRVQGAFVSDQEVSQVTDYIKEQNEDTGYDRSVEQKMNQGGGAGGASGGSDRDTLFFDAGRFIIEKDKASIGMLQRMFKIGFNRAARIMDQLAEAGVVGEEEGTKPRKILMSMEEFDAFTEAGY